MCSSSNNSKQHKESSSEPPLQMFHMEYRSEAGFCKVSMFAGVCLVYNPDCQIQLTYDDSATYDAFFGGQNTALPLGGLTAGQEHKATCATTKLGNARVARRVLGNRHAPRRKRGVHREHARAPVHPPLT